MAELKSLKKCENCGKVNDGDAAECTQCQGTEFKDLNAVKVGGDFTETGE